MGEQECGGWAQKVEEEYCAAPLSCQSTTVTSPSTDVFQCNTPPRRGKTAFLGAVTVVFAVFILAAVGRATMVDASLLSTTKTPTTGNGFHHDGVSVPCDPDCDDPDAATFITYGPPGCDGTPLLVNRFFAVGDTELKEMNRLSIGCITTGGSLGMAALEGYIAAIEVLTRTEVATTQPRPLLQRPRGDDEDDEDHNGSSDNDNNVTTMVMVAMMTATTSTAERRTTTVTAPATASEAMTATTPMIATVTMKATRDDNGDDDGAGMVKATG
ncbi:hypothetical protein EDB85DRAFT_1895511 [Lactarius pseudohatsudake]|nr:hypothetical protein EDB85DRAFT_1895511 [Lactarius pseudohatsudake]